MTRTDIDDLKLIDRGELLQIVPLSYVHIWRLMRRDRVPFPKPVVIGERKSAWRLNEVKAWLDRRPERKLKESA